MSHRAGARWVVALILLAGSWGASPVRARVLLTQEQALKELFPPPQTIERRSLYLDEAQARRAAELAGVPVTGRVVAYYVGLREGRISGYAYFDTHLVRTLPETVLIVIGPDGQIRRIDILSFDEPEDYLPSDRWLQQFDRRVLDDELTLKRGIRPMTGATLSARSITQAARRVLALHHLFVAPPPAHAEPGHRPEEGAP
jgi:hypothetical protein